MNAYQLIFKSGTSAVVYDNIDDDTTWRDNYQLDSDELVAIIDITQNTKNEAAWVIERKELLDQLAINKEKVSADAQDRAADRQVDMNIRQSQRAQDATSPLTQARLTK